MSAEIRGSKLQWLCGIAEGRKVPPGHCCWCGEPIVLVDPTDYRRRARNRHRGDEHEEGSHNCLREFRRSVVWSARDLIFMRKDPCCVDCGVISDWWEADHRVPLHRGGSHDPTNIERRCTPCHREKTKRERRSPAPSLRLAV